MAFIRDAGCEPVMVDGKTVVLGCISGASRSIVSKSCRTVHDSFSFPGTHDPLSSFVSRSSRRRNTRHTTTANSSRLILIKGREIYTERIATTMNTLATRSFSRVVARRAALAAPHWSQARLYHENIVEHYENPRNVGSLDKNDDSVGTVSVRT